MTFYRVQQALIFLIHIALLFWIVFVLRNTGSLTTAKALLHFLGISSLGAGLIFGTAKWAKYHHEKEINKNKPSNR